MIEGARKRYGASMQSIVKSSTLETSHKLALK